MMPTGARRGASYIWHSRHLGGHLWAVHVTLANKQERAQVGELAQQVQTVTGEVVTEAFADQGYTGEDPAQAAQAHGIDLHFAKLSEAQKRICPAAAALAGRA